MTTCRYWTPATLCVALLLTALAASRAREPTSAADSLGKSDTFPESGDYDKAIAHSSEAIRLNRKTPRHTVTGAPPIAGGPSFDKAIADYTEAIKLDPKLAEAFEGRSVVYSDKGEHGKAIADGTEAIRLGPNNSKAYCCRGLAYEHKGETNRAIADFNEAHPTGPEVGWGILDSGRYLLGQG